MGSCNHFALWSNPMWLDTCSGYQHWCIAHPVLMPCSSNMPFSPLSVDLSLGQAGQRLCLRPSLLYMLAGLSVSDTTMSMAALGHAIPFQHDPPFHAGQASDCFCWTMTAPWWTRQPLTTSPMLKCSRWCRAYVLTPTTLSSSSVAEHALSSLTGLTLL